MVSVAAEETTGRVASAAHDTVRVVCRSTATPGDLEQHFAIRYRVFVEEQGIFTQSDRDETDALEDTIHVVGYANEIPAGVVRLFPLDPAEGLWQGDRLAVLDGHRTQGLGAPLVRYAVALAGCLGGTSMVAHVQVANVKFFTHLGWSPQGDVELYIGRPHQQMLIDLPEPDAGAALLRTLEGEPRP